MTMRTEGELRRRLEEWMAAWNKRDIEGVLALVADDAVFEHWSGMRVTGRERLRAVWGDWFAEDETISFELEDLFTGEDGERAILRWTLHARSRERETAGLPESRRGLDVLRMENGLVVEKLTYSKTTIEIAGRREALRPASRDEGGNG